MGAGARLRLLRRRRLQSLAVRQRLRRPGARLVSAAKALGARGWNFDLEPQKHKPASTAHDALAFASFCARTRSALHAVGMRLTVSVAQWCPMLKNYTLASWGQLRWVLPPAAQRYQPFRGRPSARLLEPNMRRPAVLDEHTAVGEAAAGAHGTRRHSGGADVQAAPTRRRRTDAAGLVVARADRMGECSMMMMSARLGSASVFAFVEEGVGVGYFCADGQNSSTATAPAAAIASATAAIACAARVGFDFVSGRAFYETSNSGGRVTSEPLSRAVPQVQRRRSGRRSCMRGKRGSNCRRR